MQWPLAQILAEIELILDKHRHGQRRAVAKRANKLLAELQSAGPWRGASERCASPCGFTPAAALRPFSATVTQGFEDFASACRDLAQRARFAVGEVHLYEGKDRAR